MEQQHKYFLQNRRAAKNKRNTIANQRAHDVKFEVGDPVYYRKHLDGSTTKGHTEHLRPANLDEWVLPTDKSGRQLRPAHYVVPPVDGSSSDSDTCSDNRADLLQHRYRRVRTDSSSEDNIALVELRDTICARDRRAGDDAITAVSESSTNNQFQTDHTPVLSYSDGEDNISVNVVKARAARPNIRKKRKSKICYFCI
ncbi:hypothetical protein MAR_003192 [Mya arenaria]|uniref:Uncharacterized protein n=1 Tax=Mya arenaria TaxID=6604 RepID=A0ABY7G7V3_MYAAR|nr:hypothetical protein MAR_003192 [Mya arenaria]